jgi:glycosyltransferase involved in cell wall biosynthesis
MRVVLAQNMYHLPSRGGANRSNRLMLERLVARGHECHVVAPLNGQVRSVDPEDLRCYLASRGATEVEDLGGRLTYRYAGVTVHGVSRGPDLPRAVRTVLDEVRPDWTLVSNDDPGMMVLSTVLRRVERSLYLVHTVQPLPFGPRAFHPNDASTAMIRRCTAVLSVSRATRDYVEQWSGIRSELVYPDVYSQSTPSHHDRATHDRTTRRSVTLINACGYKGIDIFLALADAMPDVPFLAVEGWGTTDRDRVALAARHNVELLPGTDDMDEVYARTRVLLMPSLWDEAFGYCSVEAMLRGIPVLAADQGGLREATLGVGDLLPVTPISRYLRQPSLAQPPGEIPEQDVRPWIAGLLPMLTDHDAYRRRCRESRMAARDFVAGLDPDALEKLLNRLNGPVTTAGEQA